MKRTLLPYQTRWVRDRSAFKVIEKARRIGISWAEAHDAALYAAAGHGSVYYQSYSHSNASGFMADAAEWAEIHQLAAAAADEVAIDLDDRTKVAAYRLRFASGKELLAMTSAPRAFRSRGRPGDVGIVDEAAFIDDLPAVLKAVRAFRIWGGHVRVISTHNGDACAFATLVRDIREGRIPHASLHRVTFDEAVAEGLAERSLEVQGQPAAAADVARWAAEVRTEYGEDAGEELDVTPAAGVGPWLAWENIRRAEMPESAGAWTETKTGRVWRAAAGPAPPRHAAGVDIARRRHLWVQTLIGAGAGRMAVRQILEARNLEFAAQTAAIARLFAETPSLHTLQADQGGMGEAVVEGWRKQFGAVVRGVLLVGGRRLDVATSLRRALEDAALAIPADERVRQDLHSIRRVPTETGVRLVAPDGGESHGDRFWSLALAVDAASAARAVYELHRTPLRAPPRRALGRRRQPAVHWRRGASARLGLYEGGS